MSDGYAPREICPRWESTDRANTLAEDDAEDIVKALPAIERLTAIATLFQQAEAEPAPDQCKFKSYG